MRIIIITGKGGVGKTSIAAATALRTSKSGLKTLVMSTDSAHSLSDSFDFKLGAEPTPITDNLHGQEVDTRIELLKQWGNIKKFVSSTLQARGVESVVAEEISIFPGMEELFSLLLVKKYYNGSNYDVVILDCAPTSSTIRLLSFPEVCKWYLRKIFPIQRHLAKFARPIAGKIYDVKIPDDGVFSDIQNLIMSLDGIKEILTDSNITTVRLVINLEKMVIREAQRAFTYMNLFGYMVDSVFVNRIFPPEIGDGYMEKWKDIQKKYFKQAEEAFYPLRIFRANLMDSEVLGLQQLERFGDHIFGEENPTDVFCREKPIKINKDNGRFVLQWYIQGVNKEEIDIWIKGDNLILKTPKYMRNMVLPSALVGKEIDGAKFHEDCLDITFS